MESYTKDLPLQDKDYVAEIPNNELSPLEGDHEESHPHFSVEEPLEVQLRFELGSLVDAQVLLDTHGPRESHWDFVRQEQGRFQTSSEDNRGLLVHVKQDDLKPFDNCEGWPRSASQADTQLFIDSQDDVSMITEAFGGKDRNMADLVEDDRSLLLPSYRHQEEATAWIGEEGKTHEVDNSCRGNIVDEAVEASQISMERPDTRDACESSTVFSLQSDNIQIQTIENNEKHETEQSAPDLVIEPLLNSEQRTADNAASLTVSEPQCQVSCNVSEELNVYQDLPLDCSKQNQADSIQPEASSFDDVEVSVQTTAIIPTGEKAGLTMNAQDRCVLEEESRATAVETKADDETLLVISDSMENEATQETGSAPDIISHSSPKLESETPDVIPDKMGKQITSGGTCFDSESTMQSSAVTAEPESREKQSASERPCSKVDCILQGSEAVTVVETLKEISPMNNLNILSEETVEGMDGARSCGDLEKIDEAEGEAGKGLDAQEQNTNTFKTLDGMDATRSCGESEKNYETKGEAGDDLDAQEQNTHTLAIEQADTNLAGEKAVGAMELSTAEQQVTCSEPAANILKQDAADVSTSARSVENTTMCDKIECIQGIETMADLSDVTPDIALKEINLGEQQARILSGTPQVSTDNGNADSLKPADYSVESKDHAANDNVNLGQDGEHKSATPTVLTVEDSSLGDESMNKRIEAQSIHESSRQDELPTDGSEALIQELSMKHHDNDQSASDYSVSSAKPLLSNEDKNSTEGTHPGGVLHVLLDVHKEGPTGDSLLKEASVQDYVKTIESANVQKLNPGDVMRKDSASAEDVAAGLSDTYASGLTGVAAITGSQEDEQLASNYASPQQDKASKRKLEPSTRNNRLKDSARASPLQGRSDQEQKDGGKEGLGRRKSTPKNAAQKKGTELAEIISSPQKSVSKSASGRKKGVSLPMAQDVMVSPVAKDGFQTPATINKTVFAVNARQPVLPDVNGSEVAVPLVLPVQPFSEPQQVQLRAQILVYGSLIQGAAPEEALMVAAFSNVVGALVREAGRDLEASGRALWEKQWLAAVERIQAKSSRDTLRDSSRSSGVLVSNLPATSAKASEAGLKVNSSPGVTSNTVDARNVTSLHSRVSDVSATKGPSDVSATKGHPSHPRQSADPGLMISTSRSNQSVAVVVPPGPSISTAFRSTSSSLSENVSQSSKARVDLQQSMPQTYYPGPPLGSFLAGAPQWLSTTTFPGPWVPQTPAAVYNTPSPLFSHPQAIVTSDQAPDMALSRRNTPSSGTVVPINPIVPGLYTPVVGSMPITPTAAADLVQKRQSVSESRPRKRKKTQSEIYVSPTDVVPNAPFMVVGTGNQVTSVSDLSAGQGGLMMSSPVHLPSISAPESLAMVVAHSQTQKTIQETSITAVNANKPSALDSTIMPNSGSTPTRAIEQQLGKSVCLQNSASQLAQAEASAEEAASVAASAVRESESLWSQLKTQKNSGLTSDTEMQLVSSAVAMTTAASVAKAAAAAARAAYEAALQAKMISEDALGSSKQGNDSESFRLNASQVWGMPDSCNSIMAAAKLASKKRLEAASASRARAQNFESVLRAAELVTYAVSQVGSVIAMGESVPFTLEMLMEAGPEGLQTLLSLGTSEDKDKTKSKGSGLQSPGKKGTPKQKGSIEKDKRPLKKSIGANKDASIQREALVDGWTTDNVIPARSEFDARINADLGIGLMTEFSKQNINDHLALAMQASRQGLSPIRLESGLAMQQEVSIIDNKITKGSLVEVMSNEKGLRGVWFSARVQNVDGGKVFVLYDDLLSDDGFSPLEEWIQLKGSASKAPRVRLAHPNTNISFEGTRKRRREAMGNHKWSVGDRVDAWMRDGWWEGEIKEIIEDGESKAKVFFPGDGDTSLVKTSKLRPSLVWSNEHWVLWTDAKQGKNEESKGKGDLNEGETPTAKRQKTEKAQLSNTSKQKLVGTSVTDVAATQKEGSLLDSAAVKLPADFKGFTVDGTDKSKQPGSKVVFGVPRPTKKRKLIEVSKHYNSARGARSTNTLNVKAINNKHEDITTSAVGFVTGSSEVSKLDGSKAKKRVLPTQKSRSQRDSLPETAHSKGNAIRSKKDRPFADTKALARKNPSTREGVLPSASKNTEGKVINKKKLPLEKTQPESEEQPEGFPTVDVPSQKVASPSSGTISEVNKNSSSILLEESGKEPSHTAQKIGKPSEKQAVKESGKDSSHVTQSRDSQQTSVKEREIPPSQQVKDNGNKHSSKKKEAQPSDSLKDNRETAHLSKESQKQSLVQVKESESQPAQQAETVLSRDKQPTNDNEKQPKEMEKGRDVGKSGAENWEPRRTSRKIQPTSKLLEGLQTAPKLGKNSSSHDKGSRVASKAVPY